MGNYPIFSSLPCGGGGGEGVPLMANKYPSVNSFQLEVRRKSKSHEIHV